LPWENCNIGGKSLGIAFILFAHKQTENLQLKMQLNATGRHQMEIRPQTAWHLIVNHGQYSLGHQGFRDRQGFPCLKISAPGWQLA